MKLGITGIIGLVVVGDVLSGEEVDTSVFEVDCDDDDVVGKGSEFEDGGGDAGGESDGNGIGIRLGKGI